MLKPLPRHSFFEIQGKDVIVIPMVATQKPYTLSVVPDDDPVSPREDRDNFGTIVCFHRRYTLGDEHHYDGAGRQTAVGIPADSA